jgi:uncharacterized protein YdhG (YjbR/CyaY superfamily)
MAFMQDKAVLDHRPSNARRLRPKAPRRTAPSKAYSIRAVASMDARRHTPIMTHKDSHDAYIAAAPEQFRSMLGRLRTQLSQALPDAEEVIKYDMPGFQIEGTIIAGYAAFSKQCGLYVDAGAIAAHADEIAALKLKATKTGVTFSVRNPITDELVEKLAVSSRRKKGL